jgi:methionine-gamma-lyase
MKYLNNGLKTLTLRMDKHCENAMFIANKLNINSGVKKVNYNALLDNPYHDIAVQQMSQFGGMLSFEVDTDLEGTKRFIDNLKLCTHAPTLGDTDTLVLHPATSSHLNVDKEICKEYGITDNLVRMSVGIENKDDILADIEQALTKL